MDRETLIVRNAKHGLETAIEISSGTVRLSKEHAIAILELLKEQPQIVRCKDCKHHFVAGENVRYSLCDLNHNKYQSDDWFCADGER